MNPVIDVGFPVSATGSVPFDHGYALYAALSVVMPHLHGAEWLGVHPLDGRKAENRLELTERSRVRLRMPAERIPEILRLTGSKLSVAGTSLQLRPPQIHQLETRSSLDARLVLIRLTRPPLPLPADFDDSKFGRRFLEEATRQLTRLNVQGRLTLCGKRRITVSEQRLLGFTVRVDGLDADASLRLQIHGLGGKRRMGCGIFRPTRDRPALADSYMVSGETA